MLIYKALGGFGTFKISHFLTKNQFKNHNFSDASFWLSFFEILAHPGAKTIDFGIPLAPSWAPNDAKNPSSDAKMLKKIDTGPPSDRSWNRLALKERSWTPF